MFMFSLMDVMYWMVRVLLLWKPLRKTLQNYEREVLMHRLHLVVAACMLPWTDMRCVIKPFFVIFTYACIHALVESSMGILESYGDIC